MRALRDEIGLPRTKLAEASGVALTSLNLLEAGRVQPSLKTLEAIAKTLEVRVADLLDEEPLPAKKPADGTKALARIVEQLRERDPAYLRALEKLIKAFDAGLDAGR